MKLDINQFDKRVEQKLLTCRKLINLRIYNYTSDVQFKKKWDKYTLMARGLILRDDGEVIARPFPKFFNLNERPNTMIKALPTTVPEISEKLDGSLGILFKTSAGFYHIATRGSFDSDQAIWASKWLKDHGGNEKEWQENITYLFEIIYPFNRIVVNYGERAELVLIGMVHNWTGKIYSYKEVTKEAIRLGLSYPKLYSMTIEEIEKKAESSKENEEGFVLFWPDNQLMVKVKLKDYVRLHRLTFGISVKSIWENMAQGKTIEDVFKDAPDEIYNWVKDWKNYFRNKEQRILADSTKLLEEIRKMPTRKEQAIYLQTKRSDLLSIIFSMLDGKPYLQKIYNLFKPASQVSNKTYKVISQENV